MFILDAIYAADLLAPNNFTLQEKLLWCNEVNAAIRRNVKKQYASIETLITCSDDIQLPEEFSFSDIEIAYINGKPIQKSDLRSLPYLEDSVLSHSYGINIQSPKILKLVYIEMPKEIREISVKGEFSTDSDCIYGKELPFEEGDCINFVYLDDLTDEVDWSNPKKTYVISNDGECIRLSDDMLETQTSACLAVKRVIDDETEVDAPYDRMYIEYILAKTALYQHDYDGYAAHISQYNCLFDEYKKDYKSRNPLNDMSGFHNYW